MSILHLFNPDNDLALATGLEHYTPPLQAFRLRQAGAMLPLWYGNRGDRIVCRGVDNRWYEEMAGKYSIADIDIAPDHDLSHLEPRPWGWSAPARILFIEAGFPASNLPDDTFIERIRRLSHRRTAANLSQRLAEDAEISAFAKAEDIYLAPAAIEATNIDAVNAALRSDAPADCGIILKAPWSSSGRGVFDSTLMTREHLLRLAQQSIDSQGSIMIERRYTDITDFALLFESTSGKCRLWGYSSFNTSDDCRYLSNRVLEKRVHKQLLNDVVCFDIEWLGKIIARHLTNVIGNSYTGYLGVDMLTGRDGDGHRVLHPAVEINLRCTMGVVAQKIAMNHIHPSVSSDSSKNVTLEIASASKTSATNPPPIAHDRLLYGGTLQLTPPNPYFSFKVNIQ